MFRSLNVKLVLIFIVFIISVMSVVGVFLLDRVSAFYADDFLNQMDEGFSDRLKETLSGCFDTENTAAAQKEVMTAYSAAFSFDNYRNFYILDMDGNVLEGSAESGKSVTKTPNLLAAMNRKNSENRVSGSEFFDYACYITNGEDEGIVYIYDDLTRMKSLIWVLFSIILFGGLWGIVGMIVAVPLFAVVYDLIKRFVRVGLRKQGCGDEIQKYNEEYHGESPQN